MSPSRLRVTCLWMKRRVGREQAVSHYAYLTGAGRAPARTSPGVTLRIIPSDAPTASMPREERRHLIIGPRLPEGAGITQKRLFEDRCRVFYDGTRRGAPATRAEYLAADHVRVVYQPQRAPDLDAKGVHRRPGRRRRASLPARRGSDRYRAEPAALRSVSGPRQLKPAGTVPGPADVRHLEPT